jgi:DNA (cytosine-5)-methyltransferase 1
MNQGYKQFGNSVVVPLIEAIGEKIIEVLETKRR